MHGAEYDLCHGARPGRALGTLHRVARGASGASSGLVPSRGGEQHRRLAEFFAASAKLRVRAGIRLWSGPTASLPHFVPAYPVGGGLTSWVALNRLQIGVDARLQL